MSAVEDSIKSAPAAKRASQPILNRFLDLISSVRFGVIQLCILVVLAMIGMLIVQQNVDGFDAYYVSLTPAEKLVFGYLGFFDIYHSWYFNLMLLVLSLNIILASIDHFPEAWSYIAKPKLTATRDWLLNRKDHTRFNSSLSPEAEVENIKAVFAKSGFRPKTSTYESVEYGLDETGQRDFSKLNKISSTIVFGERGKWNRLGAYIVHVALLTLFLGHFVALQTGFDADVRMVPGQRTEQIQLIQFNLDKKERFNVQLPFSIECTDVQQKLIDEKANIEVTNTLDWKTQIRIDDPAYGVTLADVSLNKPFQYRGYRFFQAQTIPVGNARTITLELTPQAGGQPVKVDIQRNGSAQLADGTKIDFADFQPDFTFGQNGQPDTRSGEYNNPAAILNVTPAGGEATRVFAFAQKLPDSAPVGAPKLGYKWHLESFEKSPFAHVLSIKYDPYDAAFIAWYIGGFGLIGALAFVFFISHKRVWAEVRSGNNGITEVVVAGEANRNQLGFSDKFKILADAIHPANG